MSSVEKLRNHLECSWTRSGQMRPLLLLLNPALLKAPRYCPVPSQFLPKGYECQHLDNKVSFVGDSFIPLLANVIEYEQIAHAELAKGNFDKALEFISDFREETDLSGKRAANPTHALLRLQLLDQLLWSLDAFSPIPVQQETNLSIDSLGPQARSTKYMDELYGIGISNWLGTVRTMTQQFLKENLSTKQDVDKVVKNDGSSILHSLLKEIRKSEGERLVSSVTLNICGAALGLRALLMVKYIIKPKFLNS